MKLLSVFTVLVGSLGSAGATIISYNTTGSAFTSFTGGTILSPTSISATSGGSTATLTYNPILGGSFDDAVPGTNISYGSFTFTYTGPDVNIAFPAFAFTLKVNETSPVGTQNVSATSNAGVVSVNSSNINVFYVPTSFTLPTAAPPNTAFTVINPTQLVPSTSNGGNSSIQGFAVGTQTTSTPEPTTMFLMGAGLYWIRGSFSQEVFSPRLALLALSLIRSSLTRLGWAFCFLGKPSPVL